MNQSLGYQIRYKFLIQQPSMKKTKTQKMWVASLSEIVSAQEDTAAIQVDDYNILGDNNDSLVVEGNGEEENENIAQVISIQESNIIELPCKNDDALVVEGTTEIISFQESCKNNTNLTIKDVSKGNEDDGQSKDGIEEPSQLENIKDRGIEIHVGKLDKDTVEDDLIKVFQQFGEQKSTRIVRNKNTNKSKGFAFIQFATVDQAKRALSELKDGVEGALLSSGITRGVREHWLKRAQGGTMISTLGNNQTPHQ